MDAQTAILNTYRTSGMVVRSYIDDLSDDDLRVAPGEGCNPIAWQLGHLITAECSLLNSICEGKGIALPDGFEAKHSKEAAESGATDFCSKAEYLDLMEKCGEAFTTAMESMSAEELDQPGPEHLVSMFPTKGHIAVLISTHPMMHAGQWVPLRRKLGKPVVI